MRNIVNQLLQHVRFFFSYLVEKCWSNIRLVLRTCNIWLDSASKLLAGNPNHWVVVQDYGSLGKKDDIVDVPCEMSHVEFQRSASSGAFYIECRISRFSMVWVVFFLCVFFLHFFLCFMLCKNPGAWNTRVFIAALVPEQRDAGEERLLPKLPLPRGHCNQGKLHWTQQVRNSERDGSIGFTFANLAIDLAFVAVGDVNQYYTYT